MNKKYFILIIPVVIIVYAVIFQTKLRNRYKTFEIEFNESSISGTIGRIKSVKGTTHIYIKDNNQEYAFRVAGIKQNKSKLIHEIAIQGDSILKSQFADTIYLFHDDDIFRFPIDWYYIK